MNCPSCGTENRAGRKFCSLCGTALLHACPACGAANEPEDVFCGECGTALQPGAATLPAATTSPREPVAERRLVSVLFADLVGFTSLSESRDSEDVRELLSTYFDTCQRLVNLYGGTVEKFIGDAVMAVWGTPVAKEDDAERAVRAALDIVTAVSELGHGLQARAGVLTGEAAVTVGAEGQGMVAGDLVNTASRIQSAAEAETVLVGEATKRATEAAIAYAEAGEHELKGKTEPVTLFRALRVTAGVRGSRKSAALEPPFVGRERELRLVKELFHVSADQQKARLVSVVGIGGIGKSRLAWEFFKYIDGLAETLFWWSGRCLAYGEGVAYWALAEMVRIRADIVEGEDPASARTKLTAGLDPYITDPEERAWIEPRLASLLGLDEGTSHERDDLFAAWRLYFERLSEHQPAVLVFEDVQWADSSLLEFIEYLLEWSRNYPIYVITLARPEFAERHEGFGSGLRNATTLSLEPLAPEAMERLLSGLVPGLPDELRGQILAQAEGVPLYAVETVRTLLDRGLLEREGEVYRPTGPIEALDVPETLQALIAARLDGLSDAERRLLQDASVLGKTFTKAALSSLSGLAEHELEPSLNSLLRKEVLSLQADPRSPERGQYQFLQDLLKQVAYERLAKRERKVRHLAAASHLEQAFGTGEQEIVEVVAAHFRDAYEAAPDDADAGEIKTRAREMLARAGERAASLAAGDQARRYFEQAAELADSPLEEAGLRERAGGAAAEAGNLGEAQEQYERALQLVETAGATHPAARISARLGNIEWLSGGLEHALERMDQAFAVLSQDEPDADYAALAAELGRLHFFAGDTELASERLRTGLALAESLWLPEIIAQALNTMGVIATFERQPETAIGLYTHALKVALEHDIPSAALRVYNNLIDGLARRDRYEEALDHAERGAALARKVGNRYWEWRLAAESTYPLMLEGRWDDVSMRIAEIPEQRTFTAGLLAVLPFIEVARGRLEDARRLLSLNPALETSSDFQERALYIAAEAAVLRAEGSNVEALAAARRAIESLQLLGPTNQSVKAGYVEAFEAALSLGRLDEAGELLNEIDALPPGEVPPFLRAQAARLHARLAAVDGEPERIENGFKEAEQIFREFGIRFWLAVTELEHGEWLLEQGRSAESGTLLEEARETFERLEATPWLERLETATSGRQPETVAVSS